MINVLLSCITTTISATVNFLIDIITEQVFKETNFLETAIVYDGLVNAATFVYYYTGYRNINDNLSTEDKNTNNKLLLKMCDSIYLLGTTERYMIYLATYFAYSCTSSIYQHTVKIPLLITLPVIQNYILRSKLVQPYVACYKMHKNIFFRYTLSKLTILYIKGLDPVLHNIKNYHIFLLYHHMSYTKFKDFCKTFAFIHLLNFLRSNEATYYYYKAIKLSYYYNTGNLFNVIRQQDASYILRIIVQEKKWHEITRFDVVNALYTLCNRYISATSTKMMKIQLLKLFTVWSIVCYLKMFNEVINAVFICIYLACYYVSSIITFRRVSTTVIAYILLTLHVNDLIISLIFTCDAIIYTFLDELVFL